MADENLDCCESEKGDKGPSGKGVSVSQDFSGLQIVSFFMLSISKKCVSLKPNAQASKQQSSRYPFFFANISLLVILQFNKLFFFHSALKWMLVFTRKLHYLSDFCLCNFMRINSNNSQPFLVNSKHY